MCDRDRLDRLVGRFFVGLSPRAGVVLARARPGIVPGPGHRGRHTWATRPCATSSLADLGVCTPSAKNAERRTLAGNLIYVKMYWT